MPVKIIRAVKIIFGLLLLFFFFRITFLLFLRYYDSFLYYFVNLAHHSSGYSDLINNPIVAVSFQLLRAIFCFLTFYTGYRLYIYAILKHEYLFPKAKDRITNSIARIIYENTEYVNSLGRPVSALLLTILTIQFISFGYMLCTLPYHYDEAFSFMHFAKEGALTSMTFYPLPNNHVFFNVVSSYFLWLPIDDIIALRLSSFIFSLFSTYYFFKLAGKLLTVPASCLATVLFVFSYPFFFYGTQGRGYSMLIFFALISIYCLVCMMQGLSMKKYMTAYAFVSILGFLTMPSFLYCFVVVSLFMLLFLLFVVRREIGRFFIAHIIILFSTIFLYLTIILLNGIKALTQTNGVAQQYDLAFIKANVLSHLSDTWTFLMGGSELGILWILPLLLICLVMQFKEHRYQKNTYLLFLCLVLSPVAILFLHRTIPFPRTWSYLIIPIFISFAAFIQETARLVKVKQGYNVAPVIFGVILIISAAMTGRFNAAHRKNYKMDYVVQQFNNTLHDKYHRMNKIASFGQGQAFYLFEDIGFEMYRRDQNKTPENHSLILGQVITSGDTVQYDLIVGEKDIPFPQSTDLYDKIDIPNDYFQVWIRKGL